MTILTSTSPAGAIRWSPEWVIGDDKPVFLLRAGNVLEREMMEAELAGVHMAGEVRAYELREAIVSGFRALAGDAADELVALTVAQFGGEPLDALDQAKLAETLTQLAQHWPPYKLLLAQQHRRNAMIPIVAFRRFCCGWENVAVPFGKGADGLVDLGPLSAIDGLVLKLAGLEAWNMQHGGGQRKNSDAPSKSADDPATSTSGAPSRAGGSSAGKSTRKTRG